MKTLPLGLLLLCQQFTSAVALWPFPAKRFTKNALIDTGSLGLPQQSRALAFGDFNGDQFIDVITLAEDHQTFQVHLWDHDAFVYRQSFSHRHPSKVDNIIPSDFSYEGRLDLLVMSQESRSRTIMSLYLSLGGGTFDVNNIPVSQTASSQPVPLDANGTMKVDLLGVEESSRALKLWKNQWNGSETPTNPFDIIDPPFTGGTPCLLDDPHSSAVIDLDGDCLADLFLLCAPSSSVPDATRSYQIWLNNKGSGFTLARTGELPPNAGQVTFADMDRDGTLDMVFPTCFSISKASGVGTDCSINVVYNQQKPLCVDGVSFLSSSDCRPLDALCTGDKDFKFEFDARNSKATNRIVLRDVFTDMKSPGLVLFDTSFNPPVPQGIKLGDMNQDGYPDLLFILSSDPGGIFASADSLPQILLSSGCKSGNTGCVRSGYGTGYQILKKDANAFTEIKDAASVSFVDLDEDGTLDLLVQRTGKRGQGTLSYIQNNIFYDTFFLKAIVLNGACNNGQCISSNGSTRYMPFGVSYSGASYKYTVLDTSGRRSAAQGRSFRFLFRVALLTPLQHPLLAGQLPQTSYQSLQTPYSFIGLGRTNNYIESLFVGSTSHASEHFINMEGVVPNSKVVIKPPPVVMVDINGNNGGGGNGTHQPQLQAHAQGNWKKRLYLRPGNWIPWVTLTVVGTMLVISLIVLMLHIHEKREDEAERRKASRMINFDAL